MLYFISLNKHRVRWFRLAYRCTSNYTYLCEAPGVAYFFCPVHPHKTVHLSSLHLQVGGVDKAQTLESTIMTLPITHLHHHPQTPPATLVIYNPPYHFQLGSIPEVVVGPGSFQLFLRIYLSAPVIPVLL